MYSMSDDEWVDLIVIIITRFILDHHVLYFEYVTFICIVNILK